MLDWHPHPVDTPTPSLSASHSLELGHVRGKYIPGLIPPWKGGSDSGRAASPSSPWQRASWNGHPQVARSQKSFGSTSQWSRSSEQGHVHGYYGQEQWGRNARVSPPKRVWSGVMLNGRI